MVVVNCCRFSMLKQLYKVNVSSSYVGMEKDVSKARANPFLLLVTTPYSSVMKACKSSYTLLVQFTLRTALNVCCYIIRDAGLA